MTALFFAGFDTTKTSIHWLLLIVASQPVVQQKVQQEIDAVGRNRKICWEDRKLLPYTMATIHEMQRWVVITPLFPPRRAREPIKIGDYVYPKGCNFLVNNWNLMRNRKFFENPDDFKPERFLESDNGQFKKLDNYMPFSIGKRNCPGEHVAMMTIFLYFMTIMQKFRLTCPSGKSVNLESIVSDPVRKAFPQELCFIEISE